MKHGLVILVAAVLAFWLMSLGGGRGGAPAGTRVVEFWCYAAGGSGDRTHEFWRSVADDFERANPGVRVVTVTDILQTNYLQMLSTRILGGNPPDVAILDDGMAVPLNQENQLRVLDDFIAADPTYRSDDFPPSLVANTRVGGRQCAIPWYGAYGHLTYRKDLFAEAGVSPPRTWDELLEVCRRLQQKFPEMKYPFASEISPFRMSPWIWQNGGDILSPDCRTLTLNTPEAIGAMQFVHDLMYRHKVMDPRLAGSVAMGQLWSAGQAAMMIDGSWRIGVYDKNYPHLAGLWAVAPPPAGVQSGNFYGGQQLAMLRQARQPELAWKFMAFAASPRNQLRWSDIVGSPPANLRTLELPQFAQRHPQFLTLRECMVTGRNNRMAPFFEKLWYRRFRNEVMDRIFRDPSADVPAVMAQAVPRLQATIDQYWATHRYFVQGGQP